MPRSVFVVVVDADADVGVGVDADAGSVDYADFEAVEMATVVEVGHSMGSKLGYTSLVSPCEYVESVDKDDVGLYGVGEDE